VNARRLGLPTTPVAVIYVSEELIRLTPDLCVEMPRQRIPCRPGPQFGSRYPGDPHWLTLLDFLPDPQLGPLASQSCRDLGFVRALSPRTIRNQIAFSIR
jgi:hypothetical protein